MRGSGHGDDARLELAGAAPLGPGLPAPSPGELLAELEDMLEFRKRVDRLLGELEGSDAEPLRMADDRVPDSALGTGFAEATGLHQAYATVHDRLTGLSRILAGQISALSTALDGARNGYEGIDHATREHMWAVQAEAQRAYDPEHDPYAGEYGPTGPPADPGGTRQTGDEQPRGTTTGTDDESGRQGEL